MQTEARFSHYSVRFLSMALTEFRPDLIMGKLRLCISENNEIAGYLVTALDLATFPDYPKNYTVVHPHLPIPLSLIWELGGLPPQRS